MDDAASIAKFAEAWSLSNSVPIDTKPGLTVTELIEGVGNGESDRCTFLAKTPQ